MLGVIVKEGESFEQAMRRFKRIYERAGILSQLKQHQTYEKPSEIKRRQRIAARRKVLKEARRNQDDNY